MNTLIIFDDTGYIYSQVTGSYRIPEGGVKFLEIELLEGKILKGVDTSVSPNIPIYDDMPKTEVQLLQEQLLATQAELANLQEQLLLKQ